MRLFATALPLFTACSLPLLTQTALADKINPIAGEHAQSYIEHVFVTVPRHRLKQDTALAISVLAGQDLDNHKASNLGETLQFIPGLASASFGPGVGQPVIRGQQGPRVLSLQNSTASADAASISGDHAVSVEPLLAEKIEIIRGPASLLYGSGAIGGVVNVIDKRVPVALPKKSTLKGEVRHNSVNDGNTAILAFDSGIKTQNGGWAFHVNAIDRSSNNTDTPTFMRNEDIANELENTQSDAESFTLGASYLTDDSYIGFAYSQIDNLYGIPIGAHEHGHEEEEGHDEEEEEEGHEDEEEETVSIDLQQKRYDVRADVHAPFAYAEKIRWFLTHTDYMHAELEGDEIGTTWSNQTTENRVELLHEQIKGWHGAVGFQMKRSSLEAIGEESYLPQTDTSSQGIFILEDKHIHQFKFELGARVERTTLDAQGQANDKVFTSHNFSASSLYTFSDQARLGVAYSHSERAPVTEELFSNAGNSVGSYVEHVATGTIEVGDRNLNTERSNNIDVSFSFNLANTEGYITIFNNQFSDYIYLAETGLEQDEVEVLQYQQTGADFNGVEVELKYRLNPNRYTGQTTFTVFGDSIRGELDTNQDIPRLAPQKIGFKIDYTQPMFNIHTAVMHGFDAKENGNVNTDNFSRVDVALNITPFKQKDNVIFVQVNNLTDALIRNNTSFLRDIAPEPGRAVKAGIRFSL